MNQKVRNYFLILLCFGFLYPTVSWGAAVWDDVTPPSSVTDTNVIISGNNITFPLCETFIKALTTDVTVTVTTDSTLLGNPGGPSQFFIHAEAGFSVTFVLDFNLTFNGSADAPTNTPLLIVVSGLGTTRFQFADGTTLNLTSTPTNGGVQFYLLMDSAGIPSIIFQRLNEGASETGDVAVHVGTNSFISYLSTDAISCSTGQTGVIQFNPTNNGTGNMVLHIEDLGGVIVEGVLTNTLIPCNQDTDPEIVFYTIPSIDRSAAAGCRAIMQVVNDQIGDASYFSGLQIWSQNEHLFNLLSDPYYNLGTRTDNVPAFACDPVYKGTYSGVRYSFVVGANGWLDIQNNAYVKYVGLANNVCPAVTGVPGHAGQSAATLFKQRNPSAFWVDGNNNPDAFHAKISLGECSGLFFLSGVGSDGTISADFAVTATAHTAGAGEYVFVVEGALDVFGQNIPDCPIDCQASKIEILSLVVTDTGGPLFCDNNCTGCDALIFPARTFAGTGDACNVGTLFTYNKAAFLINNTMNLYNTSLSHTDVNHLVYENNDCLSEPTYVGGETWWLEPAPTFTFIATGTDTCPVECPLLSSRPKIELINSRLNVNTDIASTGVDWVVPNGVAPCTDECTITFTCTNACVPNTSRMVFYYNGKFIDHGTGRQMILGTLVGATTCDGCTVVSRDSHLDVMQTESCLFDLAQSSTFCPASCALKTAHQLFLQVAANTPCINSAIVCDITGQFEMNNIYLGGNSNISIGTNLTMSSLCGFACPTCPELLIKGNYFSITSKGGNTFCNPATASVTGQGGIFVDSNGTLSICPQYRASIGAMVTRSGNGIVNLPQSQVIFAAGVGISTWQLNLTDTTQQIIVGADEVLSEYVFNWIAATKDYTASCTTGFVPYNIPDFTVCDCPAVTQQNVTGLPTVQGTVDQFQIQGARIGDEPTILIDGGFIRELLFQPSNNAGDAQVAVVVLRNGGRLGVNMAKPNPQTLFAATTFGINGITIIADGDGVVEFNDDMIISSRCAFLKGPNFNSATDRLTISAEVERTLLIKSTGILDLQSFSNANDVIDFAGQIRIVVEPGARIVMGGGTYRFSNDVQLVMEPYEQAQEFFENIGIVVPDPSGLNPDYTATATHGAGLGNTDTFRVKLIGTGTMLFTDDASLSIDKDAFVGVETYTSQIDPVEFAACFCVTTTSDITPMCAISTTSLVIELQDNAVFQIGGDRVPQGGSFQVGNTAPRAGHTVTFTLLLNGVNAKFIAGPQAFVGLDVGIVDRQNINPNDWLVDVLYNVENIDITLNDGLFQHSQIFPGNSPSASLLAIGDTTNINGPLYTLFYTDEETLEQQRLSNANLKGGANLIYLVAPDVGRAGSYRPIVLGIDGTTPNPNMDVSVLASLFLLNQPSVTSTPVDAIEYFSELKTTDIYATQRSLNLGNASTEAPEFSGIVTPLYVGWVFGGFIGRETIFDLTDSFGGSQPARVATANEIGAVILGLDQTLPAPSAVLFATQLQT